MLIPGKKEDKHTSENRLDIIKSTFVMAMSPKDAEAEKEGEAFTNSSREVSLYEMHIQPMIRRARPGAMKNHIIPNIFSENSLEFENWASVHLARMEQPAWQSSGLRTSTSCKQIFFQGLMIYPRLVSHRPTWMFQMWR